MFVALLNRTHRNEKPYNWLLRCPMYVANMSQARRNVTISDSTAPSTELEPSKVARRANGDVTCVTVVLSANDLRRLGINLNETDAVYPRVMGGAVLIEPVEE